MYELQDARYKTLSFGDRQHINHTVKHTVHDGRYRIVGPELELYCIRIGGVVYPDPALVPMRRKQSGQCSTEQYMA